MTDMSMAISVLLSVIVSSLCLIYLFLRDLRIRNVCARPANADLANMMILLQTMRDIVTQQKDLARQFNESLDRKVNMVRDLVESARSERDELRRMQQEIAQMLTGARDELIALRRGIAPAPAQAQAECEVRPATRIPAAVRTPPGPHIQDVETDSWEKAEEIPDDLIDTWTGFDFGGDEPEVAERPGEPETPEAQRASREAFRSLLNIGEFGHEETASPAAASIPHTNGKGHAVPLQRRVYEYNDAGMNVGDIARELGIGKGEVRLILSLRKDKERT